MKEVIKKVLKTTSMGRVIYPVCHACYRLYSIPHKQRLLRRFGYEALGRIHEALSSASIPYFVDYGTLLGLVRGQELIPHDADMDIALSPSQRTLYEVCSALQQCGFVFNRAFEYNGKIVCLNMLYRGVPVDFFKYYTSSTTPGTMYCYSFYWDEKKTYHSDSENSARCANLPNVTGCVVRRIHGVDVCLPDNAEDILVAEYGRNWKIPDAKWQEEYAPNLNECDKNGYAVDLARMTELDCLNDKE